MWEIFLMLYLIVGALSAHKATQDAYHEYNFFTKLVGMLIIIFLWPLFFFTLPGEK